METRLYEASSSSSSATSRRSRSSSTNRSMSLRCSPPYHRPSYRKRGHKRSPLNDPDSPYFLTSGDHPRAVMVSDKLTDEDNYVTWASAMRISLLAKRMMLFIKDKIKLSLDISSKGYEYWDGLLMAWLINALSPQIASTVIRAPTAHQVWLDLEGRYKQENAPKTSEVKYRMNTLKQGTLSVTQYFDEFKSQWDQLVDLDSCKFCPACVPIYEEKLDNNIIHQFLLGLNENYRTLRT